MPRIRPYRPEDHDDLYRICVRTADNGEDATSLVSDENLPGHVWLGPYLACEPSLAFVAEDSAGLGGYVVGTLDTGAFEQRIERDWWPPLRVSYPEPTPEQAARLAQIERYALQDIHHPWVTAPELKSRFPSHLHIDLVPRCQGRGTGRQLISTLIGSLRDRGSAGVHLFVGHENERAVGFYRHIGFTEFPAADFASTEQLASDLHIFTMELAG